MKKFSLVLAFFGLLLIHTKVQAQRSPIYVDVNYTGATQTGSSTQPFKTIAQAMHQRVINGIAGMVSDEEVIVRAGVYKPDSSHLVRIVPSNAGSNGFFFTLRAEANVVLDGENLFVKKFAALIGVAEGAQYVRVEGFELRNHNNNAALTTTLANGAISNDVKFGIQVSGNSKHIEILNNKVHDMSWTTSVDPTNHNPSAADLTIMRAVQGNNNVGAINVLGSNILPMEDILVKGNEVYDVLPGFTEAITVNGYVDGFKIIDNFVHDVYNIGIVAAGNYLWVLNDPQFSTPANQNYARNGLIQGNTVVNCESPKAIAGGIYCDGSQNVIVERNIISGGQVGISVGNENHNTNSGNHIIRNNIIYNNSYSGFMLGVGGVNTGSNINNVTLTGNTLYKNNTLVQVALPPGLVSPGAEIVVQQDITNLTIKHNVVYAGPESKIIVALSNPSTTLDYNLYYTESTATPEPNAIFDFSNVGLKFYGTFAWYQNSTNVAAHGKDIHSVFADPQFVNPTSATPNFHVSANSPVIDAGDPTFVAGVNELDFDGNARSQGSAVDIGVYEKLVGGGAGNITVDGNASDWSGISVFATESNQPVTSMKVTDDAAKIYVLLEGSGMGPHTYIYIDSDNSANTGYTNSWWNNAGVDYLIEDNALYKSNCNGPSWDWIYQGEVGIEYCENATVAEVSILKSLINPSATITIGAEALDEDWDEISVIPEEGEMPSYVLSTNGSRKAGVAESIDLTENEEELSIKVYPNPFETTATVNYHLAAPGNVEIAVYDMFGKVVNSANNYVEGIGAHQYIFNSGNLKAGLYTITLKTDEYKKNIRIALRR